MTFRNVKKCKEKTLDTFPRKTKIRYWTVWSHPSSYSIAPISLIGFVLRRRQTL